MTPARVVPGKGPRTDLSIERRSRFGTPAATPLWILAVGGAATLVLIGLAEVDAGGQGAIWQFGHWNLSALAGLVAVLVSTRQVTGRERQVRAWVAAMLGLWLLYNLVYALISLSGGRAFPSFADVIGLAVFIPAIGVLVASVHGRLTVAEEAAVYLDAGIMATAVFAILLVVFGPTALGIGGLRSILVFAYPLQFLAIALAGSIAVVAVGYSIGPRGAFALLTGAAIVGFAYLALVTSRTAGIELFGTLAGPLFSIGVLIVAYGGMTWWDEISDSPRHIATARLLSRSLGPVAAGLTLLAVLRESSEFEPLEGFVRIGVLLAGTLVLIRQGLLLRERSQMLAEVQLLHDENDRLVDELRRELVERARVQDGLVNASRMAAVGELAAGVAHEVNNPLTGVLGFAEILLQDFDEADPRRKDIETIRSEALRARGIVRALRDFARPQRPEPTPTDIGELITRTLDLVRYPLVRSGVTITESHAQMGLVQVDPQAIQQVILNVLTNAMQAMPDGGTLTIESAVREQHVVVKITDSGVGMDENVAAQAFVPFFSGRRSAGAAGLGLSVSLGLVESHHGTIRIHSLPDVGTTVEIRLPLVHEPALPADESVGVQQ